MQTQFSTCEIIRFWEKVDRSGGRRSCWAWQGTICDGYGRFRLRGVVHRAHRAAWTITNGTIPDGTFVLHRCDNPRCVNPAHLFLGTNADNVRDMDRKGRGNHWGQKTRIHEAEFWARWQKRLADRGIV